MAGTLVSTGAGVEATDDLGDRHGEQVVFAMTPGLDLWDTIHGHGTEALDGIIRGDGIEALDGTIHIGMATGMGTMTDSTMACRSETTSVLTTTAQETQLREPHSLAPVLDEVLEMLPQQQESMVIHRLGEQALVAMRAPGNRLQPAGHKLQ